MPECAEVRCVEKGDKFQPSLVGGEEEKKVLASARP